VQSRGLVCVALWTRSHSLSAQVQPRQLITVLSGLDLGVSKRHVTVFAANPKQRHHFDSLVQPRWGSGGLRRRRHQGPRIPQPARRCVTAERWLLRQQQELRFAAWIVKRRRYRIRCFDRPWLELLGHHAMPAQRDRTLLQARSSKS
jgi:hypothetical protein